MQCNRCGYPLPANAPTCPRCANPTPYNVAAMPSYGPPSQPGPYGPQPQPGPYGPPQTYGAPPGAYYPPAMPYGPPPKKSGGFCSGLAIGLILLVIGLCVGTAFWQNAISHRDQQAAASDYDATSTAVQATYSAQLTPSPYSESVPPSGLNFSGTAQSIVTNAQIASAVYSDYQPKTITSTFQAGQYIYASFKVTPGHTGYIGAKWYSNGHPGEWSKLINIQNRSGYGNFSVTYYSGVQGAVELYWCATSDCQDPQLAWVRTFQVSS